MKRMRSTPRRARVACRGLVPAAEASLYVASIPEPLIPDLEVLRALLQGQRTHRTITLAEVAAMARLAARRDGRELDTKYLTELAGRVEEQNAAAAQPTKRGTLP